MIVKRPKFIFERFSPLLISKTIILLLLLSFVVTARAQTAPQFNPLDLDGDGILNSVDPDIDGDGVPNIDDLDNDNDGILDTEENKISLPALSGFKVIYPAGGSSTTDLQVGNRAVSLNTISSGGVLYYAIMEITGRGGIDSPAILRIQPSGSLTISGGIPSKDPYVTYSLKFVPAQGFN